MTVREVWWGSLHCVLLDTTCPYSFWSKGEDDQHQGYSSSSTECLKDKGPWGWRQGVERTVPVTLSLTVGGLHGCFLKASIVGHVSEITGNNCGVESDPSGTLGMSPPPPEPVLHLQSEEIEANAFGVPFQPRHSSVKEWGFSTFDDVHFYGALIKFWGFFFQVSRC